MRRLYIVVLLFALAPMASAQTLRRSSPILAMVETERDFAALSKEKGTTASFVAYIADDGILFRPKAVKGKEWLTANPPPPSDKRPWLHWEPTFAFMSWAADMGYTYGPWEYRRDIKDAEPVAFGHFLTVWKKQQDKPWKFAVDLGISHPKMTTPSPPLRSSYNPTFKQSAKRVDVTAVSNSLLLKDQAVSAQSSQIGARQAFENNAMVDVIIFREGKFPITGKKPAVEAVSGTGVWTWTPEFAEVSASGDLGHSYGTYEIREAGIVKETGNYMRIWKNYSGAWRIAVDLANPIVDGKN
jgi:ketosteroid isomerase-like protein